QVDVVAGGAPRAVVALLRLDVDGERRANRLAQLARDAALLAVRIAAQRMQPAEARTHRRLLLRELHGDLAREHVAPGERHAAQELEQHEGAEEFDYARHACSCRPPVKEVISRRRMGGWFSSKKFSSIGSTASASKGR